MSITEFTKATDYSPAPLLSSSTGDTTSTLAIESFNKGIRRDPKDYNNLDDQSKFLIWRRHVITTAPSHGVFNVLDETYKPTTEEANQLLKLQSQFLYKVFESTVKLSQGRLIIRQHE